MVEWYKISDQSHIRLAFKSLNAPRKERSLPHVFSQDQVDLLLNAPKKHWDKVKELNYRQKSEPEYAAARDAAILEVIYSGGLRISEAVNLNYEHIDFYSGSFRVKGKGRKERLCMLGKPAIKAIKSYLEIRAKYKLGSKRQKGALFVNQKGTRISARSVQRFFKAYLQ